MIKELTAGQPNHAVSVHNDNKLANGTGRSFVITDKLLGRGSYGDVFLATDENNRNVAVKCCDITDTGIPDILETSIMSSITHPNLNRALRIHATSNRLYIVQDLARTDMSRHTRRDKDNYQPTMDELKTWCYSLAQGVQALHNEGIIHADIKASNVLLYDDNTVRLTDYTLSVKKWSPTEKFTHSVCTCTHRPLECLTRKPWDESLDIWSLGCTFYEIAYGDYIFPYQGSLEPSHTVKDKEFKVRLRNRSINAIIDWSTRGPNPQTSFDVIGIKTIPIDFIQFKFPHDYDLPEMQLFNDLVCKMLIVDPAARPTIKDVVAHPFFKQHKPTMYLNIQRPVKTLPFKEHARVTRYIQRYSPDQTVQALALKIYSRCNELNHISEHLKAGVCTWIASKIVIGTPTTLAFSKSQILAAERDICHNIAFRLH